MGKSPAILATVADKTGLEEFVESAAKLGWETYAGTPGTGNALRAGRSQGDYATILEEAYPWDRRITLEAGRERQAGLVADFILRSAQPDAWCHLGPRIEMVCVNLTQVDPTNVELTIGDHAPHLDHGGLTLISAALKTNLFVVTDPSSYDWVLGVMNEEDLAERQLAKQVLRQTAEEHVAEFWQQRTNPLSPPFEMP